jgi:hypothetical protein
VKHSESMYVSAKKAGWWRSKRQRLTKGAPTKRSVPALKQRYAIFVLRWLMIVIARQAAISRTQPQRRGPSVYA